MGQYQIKYKCGHTGMERLFDKYKDRDSYAEWAAENKVCPECYRKQRAAAGPEVYVRRMQGGVEVYVTNSYEQRELLKDRGYRFGEYTRPDSPLGVEITKVGVRITSVKAWGKVVPTADAEAEGKWLAEQGWPIRVIDAATGLLQAVGEGRPDLLPGER